MENKRVDKEALEKFIKIFESGLKSGLKTCGCGNPYVGHIHKCKLDDAAIKSVAEELLCLLVPKNPYKCPVCDGDGKKIKTTTISNISSYQDCHACEKGILWK